MLQIKPKKTTPAISYRDSVFNTTNDRLQLTRHLHQQHQHHYPHQIFNMGISQSVANRKNKQITKQLKVDEKRLNREVKILLLGAGNSGKSTCLKQMRLLHAAGFNHQEREGFRMIIFSNVVTSMQVMLEMMQIANLTLENVANWDYIPLFEQLPTLQKHESFPILYLKPLQSLWNDPGIKKTYMIGNTFALNDNVQ